MKFIRKPKVVDAIEYTGKNKEDIINFARSTGDNYFIMSIITELPYPSIVLNIPGRYDVHIKPFDYLVREPEGGLHSINPDVFESMFDPVY